MRFPERFFDVGIAEGHAVSMAAGMASRGAIPVFAVYSTFLQRSYDMLIHDVAISKLHVVFAVDRAGIVPGDGETHQGVFDVAYLSSVPNMTVLCPASFAELRDMLRFAVEDIAGPVAIRFPRGGEGAYKDGGVDNVKIVREGKDFTIVTYGTNVNTAIDAANILENDGIMVEIIKLGCINPVDADIIKAIKRSIGKSNRLLILEECASRGSAGESLLASLAKQRAKLKCAILLNTGDIFPPCGETSDLRKLCGIDPDSVCRTIRGELSPMVKG
jgi:1-deoxy-D-xylulose-5-phosphate synthase